MRVPYVSSNLGKMALNDLFFFSKFGYIIITSNGGDMLVNGININDLAWPWKYRILWFCAIFGCRRVKCDGCTDGWMGTMEMDGDKPILTAIKNCHKLSRISWALAQISIWIWLWSGFDRILHLRIQPGSWSGLKTTGSKYNTIQFGVKNANGTTVTLQWTFK